MKKILILITLALFLISCTPKVKEPAVCKQPYIEWKAGECCLDANNNYICDWDEPKAEIKKAEISEAAPVENPIQVFLEQVPEKYWFHSYDTGKVIVNKDKRHSYINVDQGITDIFWDTSKKEAFELCDIEQEIIQEGEAFQKDRPICNPDFLNLRYLSPEEYESRFPVGPVDWMLKYKNKKPITVETSIQTLGVKTISPVVHFLEENGDITVLKFDYHFKVPVAIDTIRNNMRVKSLKYLYDIDFKLIGVDDPDKAMIPPEEKPQPEEPVVIVIEESELLLSNDIYVKGKVINQGFDYIPPQKLLVECFDNQGKIIGDRRTRTLEGITKRKDTEFKTYVPVKTRDFGYCTAKLR